MVDTTLVIILSALCASLVLVPLLILSPGVCIGCKTHKRRRYSKSPQVDLWNGDEIVPFRDPASGTWGSGIQRSNEHLQHTSHPYHGSEPTSQTQISSEGVQLPSTAEMEPRQELSNRDASSNNQSAGGPRNAPQMSEPTIPLPAVQHVGRPSPDILLTAPGASTIPYHSSRRSASSEHQRPEAVPPMANPSAEETQIASLVRQIDGMWETIGRLRQAHLERARVSTSVDERSDIESALPDYESVPPDYTSLVDPFEDDRNVPQARS